MYCRQTFHDRDWGRVARYSLATAQRNISRGCEPLRQNRIKYRILTSFDLIYPPSSAQTLLQIPGPSSFDDG